jgi:hypothetical protein
MNFERYAGIASAVGVVLVLTMVGWLGVAGPVWRAYWTASPDQWLGFAGAIGAALITVFGTGLAAVAAWIAIKRQVRINILTREEERIERAMPGLSDTNLFLGVLAPKFQEQMLDGNRVLATLEANGFGSSSTTFFVAEVKKRIPNADDADQRRLAAILRAIWEASIEIASSDSALSEAMQVALFYLDDDNPARLEADDTYRKVHGRQKSQFQTLRERGGHLQAFVADTANRMHRLERRRKACRKEIDEFFGDK